MAEHKTVNISFHRKKSYDRSEPAIRMRTLLSNWTQSSWRHIVTWWYSQYSSILEFIFLPFDWTLKIGYSSSTKIKISVTHTFFSPSFDEFLMSLQDSVQFRGSFMGPLPLQEYYELIDAHFEVSVLLLYLVLLPRGVGGLPHKSDGGARRQF